VTLQLSLRVAQRSLALPVGNARRKWHDRASAIITLESDTARGEGEAAPLFGLSPDSLSDCEAALRALDPSSFPEQLADGESTLAALARASSALPAALPAARSALETALLALWSRARGVPAWSLLGSEEKPAPRRIAALIQEEPEHWIEQALAARDRGLTACKLKIGRPGAGQRELARLEAVRRELGSQFTLRLDANRAWSCAEARAWLPRFAALAPELVEEPCGSLAQLGPSPVALALDESLLELAPERAERSPLVHEAVRAVVLKPTLLGGVSASFAWAARARRHGLAVILSHAFEGPHGLALSAALALSIGAAERAHGLDLEGARLAPDVLSYFACGEIRPWREPGFGELGALA